MLEPSHAAETTKRIGCPRPKDIFPIHSCVLGKARKIFWIDTVQTDENYSELCNGLSAIGYSRSAVKQNKYDEPEFFAEYSRMPRSILRLGGGYGVGRLPRSFA
jgi:hypothetical protein